MPTDTAPSTWHITGSEAILPATSGHPAVRLDLARPEIGLVAGPAVDRPDHHDQPEHHDRPDHHDNLARHDRMLGLDLRGRAHLADRWIRGGDLVAVYAPADARQLRATAMWRAVGAEAGVSGAVRAWEVVVSAQTALLQSDATLAVASTTRATSLAWGTITGGAGHDAGNDVAWSAVVNEGRAPQARAVLVRRPAEPGQPATSIVVVVHADDGRGIAAWLDNGNARIECPLFGDVLEKGVLLRSRVLAAIGPAADDTSWAARVIRTYTALPPMLDT